ncbi:hypothetical protein B0H14DRAFT_3673426 [Mycena olivaceomarginata]|nr:hypothetical protein B0H14DRAFT_3673426 [Mycena olivaceomarginata]
MIWIEVLRRSKFPPTPAETAEVEKISAIHRIPTEILCQIFTLTYTRRVGDHITEEASWRLGHICRVWRAAALGYPSLWSSITLDISLNSDRQIGHACPPLMVETQLLRSGTAPLYVAFHTSQTLFDALKMSGGPAGLCPDLTHIAAGGPQAFALDSFLDMVQSRPALSFIRAFYIEDLPERLQIETDSAVVWINEKRSEGLDVALTARFHHSLDRTI